MSRQRALAEMPNGQNQVMFTFIGELIEWYGNHYETIKHALSEREKERDNG